MSDWQPIETAPRDGTQVLVWVPDSRKVTEAWFCEETGLWPRDEAYSEYDGEPCNVGYPTHWMSLPKPPQENIMKFDNQTEELIDWLLDRDADKIRIVNEFPYTCGLEKSLNDPCDGEMLDVATLSLEDSGYAPALWELALSVLKHRRNS